MDTEARAAPASAEPNAQEPVADIDGHTRRALRWADDGGFDASHAPARVGAVSNDEVHAAVRQDDVLAG